MTKILSQDEQKDTQKQVFNKRLKIKQNTAKIEAISRWTLISDWGELFQSEETSVQVNAVTKLTVSLSKLNSLQRM